MRKSDIRVIKTSDTPSSNCQLIIRGIEPQQEVDLCTDYCANLTLIDTIDSPSTTNVNTGPLPSVSTSSEYSVYVVLNQQAKKLCIPLCVCDTISIGARVTCRNAVLNHSGDP